MGEPPALLPLVSLETSAASSRTWRGSPLTLSRCLRLGKLELSYFFLVLNINKCVFFFNFGEAGCCPGGGGRVLGRFPLPRAAVRRGSASVWHSHPAFHPLPPPPLAASLQKAPTGPCHHVHGVPKTSRSLKTQKPTPKTNPKTPRHR